MASIDELQSILQKTKITVLREGKEKFIVSIFNDDFYILKSEIDDYLKVKDIIISEPETSNFYPGYYEHLLETQSLIPYQRALRDDENSILTSQDKYLSLEISPMSIAFILKAFQIVDFRTLNQRLSSYSHTRRRDEDENEEDDEDNEDNVPHFLEAFRKINTIKIRALENSPYFNKKAKLHKIAEAGLFHYSYGYGIGYNLSQSWERKIYRLNRRRRESVQFPRRTYNSDLVSYYQLALSSDSLMLGFLALYKILEYFYLSSAENELHKRLIEKIVSPEFSHTKVSQLRLLTSLVKKHDQRMDEQRMLATVLEHYFTSDEIIKWVNEYESTVEQHFTIPQNIFGQTLTLDLNPDNLTSSLAKRIYSIRNVIVHNKEGEAPRFIPFSGQEKVLSKEISIVLFLAEHLILKTGEDL